MRSSVFGYLRIADSHNFAHFGNVTGVVSAIEHLTNIRFAED